MRVTHSPILLFMLVTLAYGQGPPSANTIRYTISLANPDLHLLHVRMQIPPGADSHDLQLPVWNATYQIRDFSQYVNWVRAKNSSGSSISVSLEDKSRWRVSGTTNGAEIDYEILANQPGPFGAELNSHHAFFNLAQILMYLVDARSQEMQVRYTDVPKEWQAATALPGSLADGFVAPNYDCLVDSPIELGAFRESDFDQDGGHYRVVVDADESTYDLQSIVSTLKRIVAAETTWMMDRPFDNYLFIYHFPHGVGGGGMEHSYSTAISLNAEFLSTHPSTLGEVSAHEFFHLWNVKRIRPLSLEPPDYTRENNSRALWFSEGATSTVAEISLRRAGLLDGPKYLQHLASTIGEFESAPAHLTQSAEQSSLDAWLEKYQYYRTPERSVSYYTKGELLGTILDLAIRDASDGRKSLRDLFLTMNADAQKGRLFADSDGVREVASKLSHRDFAEFFSKYVAGTAEIPWDDFFRTVGLHVVTLTNQVVDVGFFAVRNFDSGLALSSVQPGSAAEQAGMTEGDIILEVNGKTPDQGLDEQLSQMYPGDTINVKVANRSGKKSLHWKLAGREETQFQFKNVDHISAEQRARRAAWLKGESESAGESRP
jgi:predicted metalloprotease with PDZ domain